ncbi:hypothetical protein BUALT_Bualt03G0192700 [Buddleja alternifolia]|uniref:Uncharacterized protein n=1 Tax=Buddleja alternifolia TaxID=168488 RepID=A0AAV6Y5W2_9LAMI|nr:hypothetical protein BUALT_Bualt03G0192700 [Buddleja alternifolia]
MSGRALINSCRISLLSPFKNNFILKSISTTFSFDRFTVEDRPNEQWITLRDKTGEDEKIKIKTTMFDSSITGLKSGEEILQLHIRVLVDIWKGEESDSMEFVAPAWKDSLEIQKFIYLDMKNLQFNLTYMDGDIKKLNSKMKTEFYEFLIQES